MRNDPGSRKTVCPYSGVIAEDSAFQHPADLDAALKIVQHAVLNDVEAALGDMLKGFGSGNGLIKVTAKVENRHRPKPYFGRRDLLRELICDHCGRDYGVFAIGLFCPDCGAPNLRLHFAREVELVRMQAEIAEAQTGDAAELAYRLLGNAHEDVLTAFEAAQKTVYAFRVANLPKNSARPKPVGNDFQNIERATRRFAQFGFDPFAGMGQTDVATLGLNIQKRHVIGHNLGLVDEKFANMSEDAKIGETVELVSADVREFAELCQRVVDSLDDWLVEDTHPALVIAAISADDASPIATGQPETQVHIGQLGPLAVRLGQWLAAHSDDGLSAPVDGSEVQRDFADTVPELQEAIAELAVDGYVAISPVMSGGIARFSTTADLFITFDPFSVGSNPVVDAADLCDRILAGPDSVSSKTLHESTAWTIRRFNPALLLVIDRIDQGRVSQTTGTPYPTSYFSLMPADRVELKRLAAQLRG